MQTETQDQQLAADALAELAPGCAMSVVASLKASNVTVLTDAEAIYADYDRIFQCHRNAVMAAIDTGNRLISQKEKVGHGHWEKWLKENCSRISKSTSERLMRAAEYANAHEVKAENVSQLYIESSNQTPKIKTEPGIFDPIQNWANKLKDYDDDFFSELDHIQAPQLLGWIKDAKRELDAMEKRVAKKLAGGKA